MIDKARKLVPLCFFCLFSMKALVLGASWTDLGFLAVLAGISAFFEYFSNSKELEIVHKRLAEVDKHLTELYKKDDEIKTYVSSAKLGASLRSGNGSIR
jgi:hypothetical protein